MAVDIFTRSTFKHYGLANEYIHWSTIPMERSILGQVI
jgi:hypothetical protein